MRFYNEQGIINFVKRRNKVKPDCNAYRRADRAHVLRTVNRFDSVSRDIGKELAGKVVQRAATDKTNDV